MRSQKWQNDLCFQGKAFNITVIQVYALTSNAEEAEVEQFSEDLEDLLTNNQKRCPFHYRGLECKSEKSRYTWSNRQIWPWSTEWSRAKANRVLPRECTGHKNTITQDYTCGHQRMANTEIRLIIFFAAKDGETLYSQQKQDWKLTVAQNLNQIPYDYTMEVTNRVKGLALIDRVPEELWTEVHDIVHEAVIKTISKKKKHKKRQNACLRMPDK